MNPGFYSLTCILSAALAAAKDPVDRAALFVAINGVANEENQ